MSKEDETKHDVKLEATQDQLGCSTSNPLNIGQ
jgi:hypothetical protein